MYFHSSFVTSVRAAVLTPSSPPSAGESETVPNPPFAEPSAEAPAAAPALRFRGAAFSLRGFTFAEDAPPPLRRRRRRPRRRPPASGSGAGGFSVRIRVIASFTNFLREVRSTPSFASSCMRIDLAVTDSSSRFAAATSGRRAASIFASLRSDSTLTGIATTPQIWQPALMTLMKLL